MKISNDLYKDFKNIEKVFQDKIQVNESKINLSRGRGGINEEGVYSIRSCIVQIKSK